MGSIGKRLSRLEERARPVLAANEETRETAIRRETLRRMSTEDLHAYDTAIEAAMSKDPYRWREEDAEIVALVEATEEEIRQEYAVADGGCA